MGSEFLHKDRKGCAFLMVGAVLFTVGPFVLLTAGLIFFRATDPYRRTSPRKLDPVPTMAASPQPCRLIVNVVGDSVNGEALREWATKWLTIGGYDAAPPAGANPAFSLKVEAETKAHSASYTYETPQWRWVDGREVQVPAKYSSVRWTGTHVKGTIRLEQDNKPVRASAFEVDRPAPGMALSAEQLDSPAKAPFRDAFFADGSFAQKLPDLMADVLGPRILVLALGHRDYEVNKFAERSLCQRGNNALPELLAALRYDNAEIRRRAMSILNTMRAPEAVDALIEVVNSGDDAAPSAAQALGAIGDRRAIDPLIAALDDRNVNTRAAAATALGQFGDGRARPRLQHVANNDVSPSARHAATLAIEAIEKVVEKKPVQ